MGSNDDDEDHHLATTVAASASHGDKEIVVSNSEDGGKKVDGDDGTDGRRASKLTTAVVISPDGITSDARSAAGISKQVNIVEEADAAAISPANSVQSVELASGDTAVRAVNASSKSDEVTVTGVGCVIHYLSKAQNPRSGFAKVLQHQACTIRSTEYIFWPRRDVLSWVIGKERQYFLVQLATLTSTPSVITPSFPGHNTHIYILISARIVSR